MIAKDVSARISLPVAPRPAVSAKARRATPKSQEEKQRSTPQSRAEAAPKPARREQPAQRQKKPEIPAIEHMALLPHPDGWALMIDDIEEPAWVVPTKKRALAAASDAAVFHGCPLDVHKKDGKKQRTLTFDGPSA